MDEVALSRSLSEMGEQNDRMLAEGFEPPPISDAQRRFVADCVPLLDAAVPAVLVAETHSVALARSVRQESGC